jgi:hypothetical protein
MQIFKLAYEVVDAYLFILHEKSKFVPVLN